MTQLLKRAIERLHDLPPEEQDRIGQRLLDELPAGNTSASAEPETLADALAPYIGTFDSSEHVPGGARMSEDTGRKFAEGMAEKRKQGRL
ncbi:MAG: hypothetical protein AAGI91_11020 [Bacteroidota bacterium]